MRRGITRVMSVVRATREQAKRELNQRIPESQMEHYSNSWEVYQLSPVRAKPDDGLGYSRKTVRVSKKDGSVILYFFERDKNGWFETGRENYADWIEYMHSQQK